MSVILDALKKAQNERKNVTGNLPYNPRKKPDRVRWIAYGVASVIFSILIVFLLLPNQKTRSAPPVQGARAVQVPPQTPPVIPDKAGHLPEPAISITGAQTQSKTTQAGTARKERIANELRKTDERISQSEPGKKGLPVASEPESPLVGQDSSRVLITSVDHDRVNTIFGQAIKETEKGNYSEAKGLYLSIIEEHPGNVEALNNLGVIAMKEANPEEALYYFNLALQQKKDYGKAYNNLGLLLMKEGNKRIAEEYFRKSIELGEDRVEPALNLAALLRGERRYDEASRILEGAMGGQRVNKSLYLSYALIKDDMGQHEAAIKYYTLFLRESSSTRERNEVIERIKTLENARSSRNR